MDDPVTIVILGTADWSQPIATNQHYVARELAQSFDVRFVESIGLRRPEMSIRDVRRIAKRFRRLFRRSSAGAKQSRDNGKVAVITPLVLPIHEGVFERINGVLVRRALSKALAQAKGRRMLWSYNPVTYGVESQFDAFVYHCVDLLGEVEGISSQVIASAEKRMASKVDMTFATTEVVAHSLRSRGHTPVLWPNVADVSVIESAKPSKITRAPGRVVFAGNLAPQKVDFRLLRALLERGVDLHLAGPIAEGGGEATDSVERLVRMGATYHGSLSLHDLSGLYWSAAVGLIPYIVNPYTRGVSPLKTFEYLAAGLGVVSTAVPAVEPMKGHVWVEPIDEKFVSLVEMLAQAEISQAELDQRSAIARQNSWVHRGEQARAVAKKLLGKGGSS